MEKDILTDLANASHYERNPKSLIGLLVIVNFLAAGLLFCSLRAIYLFVI